MLLLSKQAVDVVNAMVSPVRSWFAWIHFVLDY